MVFYKKDFATKVAEKLPEMKRKDVENIVSKTIETIREILIAKDEVVFSGLGKFKTNRRAARVGFNPKKKEKINIPERLSVVFSPGKELKEAINQ